MSQPSFVAETSPLALVILSILCLPASLIVTLLAHVTISAPSGPKSTATPKEVQNGRRHAKQRTTPSHVLITGLGMAKGLTLARAFYLCGHRVIGADFESSGIPCPGRYSKALSTFYPLMKPSPKDPATTYIRRLVEIVETEDIDLWVSCSGVASAVEDALAKEAIEKRTSCTCVQFDVQTTLRLHKKDSFMQETRRLGLSVPQTHSVTSSDDVLKILSSSILSDPDRQFILKPIGVDDVHRGDMTLFPCTSPAETKARVTRLPISPTRPWILQQFIPGSEEYCTHALVIRGVVRCFVACPSAELLMHYSALPTTCALSRAMLAFTREWVARSPDPETWTGHLSFDFMFEDGIASEEGFEKRLYAIECNPRAHTAVVLFHQYGPAMAAMVRAYISATSRTPVEDSNGRQRHVAQDDDEIQDSLIVPPVATPPRYWIGHDLVSLVLHRAGHVVTGNLGFSEFLAGCVNSVVHVGTWKEGTFDAWDPWPAFVLYHVYWPLVILSAWWRGDRWSRLNVSTTKMFAREN